MDEGESFRKRMQIQNDRIPKTTAAKQDIATKFLPVYEKEAGESAYVDTQHIASFNESLKKYATTLIDTEVKEFRSNQLTRSLFKLAESE